jgi:hypothetical protein
MDKALSEQKKQQLIDHEVHKMLGKSQAWRSMSEPERMEIARNTSAVVKAMAETGAVRSSADPYAVGLADSTTGGTGTSGGFAPLKSSSKSGDDAAVGEVINAGVDAAARMVNEIDFPTFVASLIEGTFHAIVKSSIEQMNAYAEMVKSVSQSLNDFRDQNVSENQGRDQLVAKYPQIFQINISQGQPKVQARDDVDTSSLPDFQKDFGLSEGITDLDEETIEQKLVPAARDELARGRQQLLATVILMGINRIIVTDGKINAKLRFQFSATERMKKSASSYDYENEGNITTSQGQHEYQKQGAQYSSGQNGGGWTSQGASVYSTGQYQSTTQPDVRVTSEIHKDTDGSIQASGQIMGEVSVNFRSETFPLEKMVNTDQMFQLQQAQAGAGRGAPAPAAAPAATGPAPASTAPAAAPAPAKA